MNTLDRLFAFGLVTLCYCGSALAEPSMASARNVEQAQRLLMSDPVSALRIAQREANAAKSALGSDADRTFRIAKADWLAGAALVGLAKPDQALTVLRSGLNSGILLSAPNSKLVGDLYMAQSNALMYSFRVEAALPAAQRAYNIYVAANQLRSQALALLNIGSIYLVARDYVQALRYYSQAIERFPGDASLLMAAHANRGQAYLQEGNGKAAQVEYGQAVDRAGALGSALMQQRYLGNLASAQLLSNEVAKAKRSLAQGYALSPRTSVDEERNSLDWVAAQVALREGKTILAASLVGNTFGNINLAKTSLAQRDGLRAAYEIYKAAGQNAKALTYLEAYKAADDKARSLAASASAALMSARFDYVNQQSQIQQLHANQLAQAAAARSKLRSTILKSVLLAGGVVVSLLLFLYFSIRRSRDQVRAANGELTTTNIALEKALAARTEFLAMTSHEIRTPLNGILGMTQVLLADRALDAPVRGKIELVHGAGETMKSLVDDLLDIAKMNTGEVSIHKAEMDLARLLRDASQVWSAQAEQRGLRLVLDIAEAPARIVEDETRLRQVVFNLMSNALKFTDQGEVRLTARTETSDAGERLQLVIRDSGIGIPAAQLEEIFESFRQVDAGVTRRHGGTGLGLAICRSLARAMGGDVTVTSVLGAGSTFLIDLPLERVSVPERAVTTSGRAGTLKEAHLLLIEANPITQSVMRSVFGAHVSEVTAAASADEALAVLEAGTHDLIVADGASLGLDVRAVERLAAATAEQAARMVLLWPSPDEACRATLEPMVAALVAKPISAAALVAAVGSLYVTAVPDMVAA